VQAVNRQDFPFSIYPKNIFKDIKSLPTRLSFLNLTIRFLPLAQMTIGCLPRQWSFAPGFGAKLHQK